MQQRLSYIVGIAFAFCCLFAQRSEADASYSPPSTMCIYMLNPSLSFPLQYPCPPTSPNPKGIISGTSGLSGYAFNDGVGFNIHLSYPDYQNYTYLNQLLATANIHHVRDGAAVPVGNTAIQSEMNTLGAAGVKFDLILPYQYGGHLPAQGDLGAMLSSINASDIYAVEGMNEQDICCGDGGWVADDQNELENVIYPYVRANYPTVKIIGPSTGNSNDAPLGDLSAYEDFGNTHDYMAGFYPEISGWGGPGYGGFGYGSVQYNQANAEQASLTKPIAATEFGDDTGGAVNDVDNLAQGTYLIRQILWHYINGLPISYIYQLIDDGDNRGLIGADGSQRPAYSELSGFLNILADSKPSSGNCIVPVLVNTAGVDSFGVCKSSGEYDLILWQPVDTHDPNTLVDTVIPTINASLTFTSGFTPTSQTYRSYNTAGAWSTIASPSPGSVPVTDRPAIYAFNGPASPTPVPTNPPVQNPT